MSKTLEDFKKFIKRGNVIDMAVGVVVGIAFGAISKSLVDDIIMPAVGVLTGNVDFKNMFFVIKNGTPTPPYATLADANAAGAVTINYGSFINTIVNFLIIAAVMFVLVKLIERMTVEDEAPTPEPKPAPEARNCPFCRTEIDREATKCPHCTSDL